MDNFFSRSYRKEGPGVSKAPTQKKRFFLFFELFFRKFGQNIGVCLLFLLCCLPVVTFGPACCGLALVLRNFVREEHAFVVHDFFRGFKENFKQGLLVGLLNLAAFGLTGFACYFYFIEMADQTFMMVFFAICMLCLIIELFMTFYAYTMIVTFTLPTKKLIKNAFLLSLIGVRSNVITLFWMVALLFVGFFLFTVFPALILLIPVVLLPMALYIIAFNSYPHIQKHLIDPYLEKQQNEEPGEPNGEEGTIFTDDVQS